MSREASRRRPPRALAATALAASVALSLAACGEKEEPDLSTVTAPAEAATVPTTSVPTPTTPPPTPEGGTGTTSP